MFYISLSYIGANAEKPFDSTLALRRNRKKGNARDISTLVGVNQPTERRARFKQ
jgi:hypothetical protein